MHAFLSLLFLHNIQLMPVTLRMHVAPEGHTSAASVFTGKMGIPVRAIPYFYGESSMDSASCVALWLSASVAFMAPYDLADTRQGAKVFKGEAGMCSGIRQEVALTGENVPDDPSLCAVSEVKAFDMGGWVSVEAQAVCASVKRK
jgi:hypothetical protein